MWGQKIWGPRPISYQAHGLWPMPRRKKCPRTNKGNPDCQDILPRTTLSSVDQSHGKGKYHVTRGSPLEHPKEVPNPTGQP